jgi:hypothetical protein
MSNASETQQQEMLKAQVAQWKAELSVLANKIAFATGTSCALVLITATDEAYTDIHPQLVLEDAVGVNPRGWPKGFDFDLLNPELPAPAILSPL